MNKEIEPNIFSNTKGKGLIVGYKPNRLSFYILMLQTNRLDMLHDALWKDMEKYKEKE
tara:strand:- start:3223 stop:3396 length:174 start_codon:yes stop_codon:yes gene_type:complete